jgi:glyoxylase I family protein
MTKFDHVAITVQDLDKSVQWYQDNFDFSQVRRFEKSSLEIKGATLKQGDFVLELLEPDNPFIPPRQGGSLSTCLGNTGANHLAFVTDDIEATYNRLKDNQVQMVTKIIDARTFFCMDQDCVLIEIRQG